MALSNWVEPAAREYDTRLEANDDQLQYVLTKSGGRHSYGTAAEVLACLCFGLRFLSSALITLNRREAVGPGDA